MVGVGHKQSFHGETVYAEMLIESEKILTSMKKVGWIDIQTDKVSMSTMVYTEDLETCRWFHNVSSFFPILSWISWMLSPFHNPIFLMTNSWDDTLEHPIAIERNLHVIHPHGDFLAPRTCHFEWENPMVLG